MKYSAVTYSNEFKIKMSVNCGMIDQFTVYSMEVATEMSRGISKFTGSNYGIGITGMLNYADPDYPNIAKDAVHISIYNKDDNNYHNRTVRVTSDDRIVNKNQVINHVADMLLEMIG